MIDRTLAETACMIHNGNSTEIKIYPRESRNYDFQSEKAIDSYNVNTIKTWRSLIKYDGFDKPALCTLIPDSCTVTEELNGTYEATFTTSVDKFGKYKNVREFNFVRILNNLFYIYKVDYNTTSSGTKITAYCLQVTYLLKNLFCPDMLVYPVPPISFKSPDTNIDDWLCRTYADFLNYTKHVSYNGKPINFADKNYYHQKFLIGSDIKKIISDTYLTEDNPIVIEPYNRSFIEILLGEKESFMSILPGEVYRFGFCMTINQKKEDSMYNAFSITIGANRSGIKRTVDYSNFCTDFRYEYSYNVTKEVNGELQTTVEFDSVVVRSPSNYGCPTQIYKTHYEEYDENPDEMALYYAKKYFDDNYALKVKYNVSISGTLNNSDFSGLVGTSDIRVGDEGYINDIYFGSIIKAKVTKLVLDGKNGEIKSVELDCTSNYEPQQNDTQYINADFIQKVSQTYRLWKDVARHRWKDVSAKTWKKLKGE